VKIERSLGEAGDAAEDLVGRLDPDEGLRVPVGFFDVGIDRCAKLILRAVAAAAQLLIG
jgi:hypothetical protein